MDLSNIKSTIFLKYSENKADLSNLDFWSFVSHVRYFSFKTSQVGFRYLKSNPDLDIVEERVSSGKMSLMMRIEPIKLDDFVCDMIEVVQDIDVKTETMIYESSCLQIKPDFNTKNSLGRKDLRIYDARCQEKRLTMRIATNRAEYIQLYVDLS